MYMRFVSPLRSDRRGVDLGIFQCAIECRDDMRQPEFLREAIRTEFDWFKKELPSPKKRMFQVKSKRAMLSVGICWFKSHASEMIERAFTLRALLDECGYRIVIRTTYEPGQILYTDDFQIVAKPGELTPTRWH